jgi:beta-phosphoglucomutase-like phosphatase (HAD superfamily)
MRAVFFDNDDVLVDNDQQYFRATREVFRRKGVPLTREMYREYFLKQGETPGSCLRKRAARRLSRAGPRQVPAIIKGVG